MTIGRQQELAEFNRLYNSGNAEFVAVYGRRRVGKTYLINEALAGKITFHHAGLSPVEGTKQNGMKQQLQQFYYSLLMQGMPKSHCPKSWLEAFFMLETHLQAIDDGSRQVVFLDELPWMDTPRSGFVTALEGFWNGWASARHNLMLVVCGSSSSWILNNLINNHGGLYGRVTREIYLRPFTLAECEAFYTDKHIPFSRYDIVQSYMILGGIPYYMGYMEQNKSFAQNIDNLLFRDKAPLSDEYERLFRSIFVKPDATKRIIEVLATRHKGYTRTEISQKTGIPTSGDFSKLLQALVSSNFAEEYVPFGCSKRDVHYKLIDPFCWFYLRFVRNRTAYTEQFWQQHSEDASIVSWRGFAFELVCMNHIQAIKQALGIQGISTTQSAWTTSGDEQKEGTQIDMLIERKDNVVNMCEMKFYSDEFTVDKAYHLTLMHRQEMLRPYLSRKQSIISTLITTFGLKQTGYWGDFPQVVTMDDLFR